MAGVGVDPHLKTCYFCPKLTMHRPHPAPLRCSALMEHMEDFYLVALRNVVSSTVDAALGPGALADDTFADDALVQALKTADRALRAATEASAEGPAAQA